MSPQPRVPPPGAQGSALLACGAIQVQGAQDTGAPTEGTEPTVRGARTAWSSYTDHGTTWRGLSGTQDGSRPPRPDSDYSRKTGDTFARNGRWPGGAGGEWRPAAGKPQGPASHRRRAWPAVGLTSGLAPGPGPLGACAWKEPPRLVAPGLS